MAAEKSKPAMGEADVSAVQAENAALRQQQNELLDLMVEMKTEIDQLKARQEGAPAVPDAARAEAEALEREMAALRQEFAEYPQVEVALRTAMTGQDASTAIRLKGEPPAHVDPQGEQRYWHLRWFNLGIEGRSIVAESRGYEKVRWEDVQDAEALVTTPQTDAYVRRGERGQEVLYKMPRKLHEFRQKLKASRSQGVLSSASAVRDLLANGVAAHAGATGMNADQAGSFVQHKSFEVTVKPSPTETVTL